MAREIRFHELLHVKYSPDTVPGDTGATVDSIKAAEDCRINLLGTLIREHDALGATPMHDAFTMATTMTERDMARLVAACCGYSSFAEWTEKLRHDLGAFEVSPGIPDWLQQHSNRLRRTIRAVVDQAPEYFMGDDGDVDPLSSFEATIRLAHWLDTFGVYKASKSGKDKGGEGDGDYADATEGGNGEGDAQWGAMRIETPPLTVRHKTARSQQTVPSSQGMRPTHLNRLATGEIFGRPVKRAIPDAVLIDQSGSMHWDSDKLAELVSKIPVGIVAGYSGACGEGVLRILAKDGRMVKPELVKSPYGGNEVDGPALRWLARQPGRRVWVSDEGVCSDAHEGDDSILMDDCDRVRKAAGIRTCLSTDPRDILAALRKGGK